MDGSDDMRQLYPRQAGFMKASLHAGMGLIREEGLFPRKALLLPTNKKLPENGLY